MSLLLRQKTQEALNNMGLTSFHTQINNNKTLEIVTRCGKPFVTIQGIKFNKNSLSLAEIEFALNYLSKFIAYKEEEKLLEETASQLARCDI